MGDLASSETSSVVIQRDIGAQERGGVMFDLPKGYSREIWRAASLAKRELAIDSLRFNHPHWQDCIAAIDGRVQSRRISGVARGILILAEPGGGKTTFMDHLLTRFPRRIESDLTLVPFVGFPVPSSCRPVDFLNQILHSMGDPDSEGRDLRKVRSRVFTLIKKCMTEVIAIDNVQDIPEKRGPKGLQNVGTVLRDLSDVGVVLALLGTEDARPVVNSNIQLRSRVPGFKKLCNYDIETVAGLSLFMRVIHEVDIRLPLATLSGIGAGGTGRALAFACNGSLRTLKDLILRALTRAVEDGREQISHGDLSRAFCELFLDAANEANPFAADFAKLRRLTRPGEAHFYAPIGR